MLLQIIDFMLLQTKFKKNRLLKKYMERQVSVEIPKFIPVLNYK